MPMIQSQGIFNTEDPSEAPEDDAPVVWSAVGLAIHGHRNVVKIRRCLGEIMQQCSHPAKFADADVLFSTFVTRNCDVPLMVSCSGSAAEISLKVLGDMVV